MLLSKRCFPVLLIKGFLGASIHACLKGKQLAAYLHDILCDFINIFQLHDLGEILRSSNISNQRLHQKIERNYSPLWPTQGFQRGTAPTLKLIPLLRSPQDIPVLT